MNVSMEVRQGYNKIQYNFNSWSRFTDFMQESFLSGQDIEVRAWLEPEDKHMEELPDLEVIDRGIV